MKRDQAVAITRLQSIMYDSCFTQTCCTRKMVIIYWSTYLSWNSGCLIVDGNVNSDFFLNFIQQCLFPILLLFDGGGNPCSVVVFDN